MSACQNLWHTSSIESLSAVIVLNQIMWLLSLNKRNLILCKYGILLYGKRPLGFFCTYQYFPPEEWRRGYLGDKTNQHHFPREFDRTLKFPKYSNTQNICCNHSKIWTMWLYHRVMSPNDADGIANSVDPDQTAPLGAVWFRGAVWSGSALFAQAYLSKNLGSLR